MLIGVRINSLPKEEILSDDPRRMFRLTGINMLQGYIYFPSSDRTSLRVIVSHATVSSPTWALTFLEYRQCLCCRRLFWLSGKSSRRWITSIGCWMSLPLHWSRNQSSIIWYCPILCSPYPYLHPSSWLCEGPALRFLIAPEFHHRVSLAVRIIVSVQS